MPVNFPNPTAISAGTCNSQTLSVEAKQASDRQYEAASNANPSTSNAIDMEVRKAAKPTRPTIKKVRGIPQRRSRRILEMEAKSAGIVDDEPAAKRMKMSKVTDNNGGRDGFLVNNLQHLSIEHGDYVNVVRRKLTFQGIGVSVELKTPRRPSRYFRDRVVAI